MAFKGVDYVHGSDGLALGVFGVGDGIPDDVLEEHLEDTTGLFVDEARDTLDTSTTCQTADGGLGDTLDVITQHLSVPLGASLSESLASLSASSHGGWLLNVPPNLCSEIFILCCGRKCSAVYSVARVKRRLSSSPGLHCVY